MPNNAVVPELNDFTNENQAPRISNLGEGENKIFEEVFNNILVQWKEQVYKLSQKIKELGQGITKKPQKRPKHF